MKIFISLSVVYSVEQAEGQLQRFLARQRSLDPEYQSRVESMLKQRIKDAKKRQKVGLADIQKMSKEQEDKWRNNLLRLQNRLTEVQSQIDAMEGHRISPTLRHNLQAEREALKQKMDNVRKMLTKYSTYR